MKFMVLINYDPTRPTLPDDPITLQPEHAKLEAMLRERGQHVAGGGLVPVEMVKPIRVRGGKTLASDGPFAETKEVLGGFYVIEVPGEDEAVEFARQIPLDSRSWVEVRRIPLFHQG